ncbi:hypothetical protein GIB67_034342 [Kingdonia uniflora]|uniref:Uncharacterized protein n=1 Tax=Kingdonia uniflora TaxID=39325 RepID=A0A7J7NSC8_9MAGN|nr:hypothetical protein GIB67_034342 [Kingdonia uniflora]
MVIRSTPSNDNTPSNWVYTTNNIMSPSLLTPSTENAFSRRMLAQRGRRKRECDSIHYDVEVVYYNPIESDGERNIDDEGNDSINEVDKGNINGNDEEVQLGCHFLGQMDIVPNLNALPNEFQELYDSYGPHSRLFRRYMRKYNAVKAFTSPGVHMDNRVAHG